MYLLIHSLKNIVRNKGRNILIGMIILVTISVSIVSLSINNTTSSIIDDIKSRYGSEVTIAPDMSKLMSMEDILSGGTRVRQTTPKQYLDFADSPYLKEAVITATAGVAGDGIKAVDEDNLNSNMRGRMISVAGGADLLENYKTPVMNLIGNKWDEFHTGFRQLMDGGKMPERENEAIISRELAELNDLTVGDKIRLVSSIINMDNEEQKAGNIHVELVITGIYIDATDPYPAAIQIPTLNRRNEILTTIDTLINHFDNAMRVDAKYYLKEPSMLKDFEAELRAKGLDEYYLVSTDEAGYERVVGPIVGLKKISLTFLVVVLAFGVLILMILSSIAIRERKYEIGVLRAMGMKKKKVALGLLLEMLLITACCLLAGLGIGTVAAQPVSDALLAGQIENAKAAPQQGGMMRGILLGGQALDKHVPLEHVDVSVGMDTMLQIAILSILLASIASIVSIAKVTKYEPIKILMERN